MEELKEKMIVDLQSYTALGREITEMENELERLRAEASGFRQSEERTGNTPKDKIGGIVAKMTDLKESRAAKLEERIAKRKQIETMIDRVENPEERMVLHLRYIQGLSWREVYDRVNFEWSTMYRLHRSALEHLLTFYDNLSF